VRANGFPPSALNGSRCQGHRDQVADRSDQERDAQAERLAVPQQGAEHGHAERSAGLAGGVQDAAGHARVPGADRAHYRCGHGRHGQRDQAEQDRAGQDQRERGGGTGRSEQGRADGVVLRG
jgi:hypothetical protein